MVATASGMLFLYDVVAFVATGVSRRIVVVVVLSGSAAAAFADTRRCSGARGGWRG